MLEWIFYDINNSRNDLVMFGVNFIYGDWSSCIGGYPFLATPSIYRLFSSWVFKYKLLSIAYESQPLFFPIPPDGISYINPIFTLISIYFAISSADSSTTPTAASSALKSAASSSSS